MSSETTNIESVLHEERAFPPPEDFARAAHVKSAEEFEALRREAEESPEVSGRVWPRRNCTGSGSGTRF